MMSYIVYRKPNNVKRFDYSFFLFHLNILEVRLERKRNIYIKLKSCWSVLYSLYFNFRYFYPKIIYIVISPVVCVCNMKHSQSGGLCIKRVIYI